jgi:N-acetylglucosaminyldiphosphoundecaprenol N-acetyl-beta-D-mannosaminyltransferase
MNIFGLDFCQCNLDAGADMIVEAGRKRHKCLVVTPNVDHIVKLSDDDEMRRIYRQASLVFADGMPLVWLSKILPGKGLPARVTGADLVPLICRKASQESLKVFFLGGDEGVAEKAARKLRNLYKGLLIETHCPAFGFENNRDNTEKIINFCNQFKPDILFIGVGTPKQEKWAWEHFNRLDSGPIIGVGASFDFIAGTIRRAPIFFQRIGLEWFWRLLQEPARLSKRYLLRGPRFLLLAVREFWSQWQRKFSEDSK